jgi:RNA polymerase sigma-70 factor (ECF subfamily)
VPEPTASPPPDAPEKGAAFVRLFAANQRRVFAYVLTLVPRRADADDIVQEASVVMWEKFDPANPPTDFAAWGCRIAYFKVLDYRKRFARSKVLFSQDVLDRIAETAAEQAGALQLDDRREALSGCLDKLRPKDRDLLARRFEPGATTQSVAAAVGRSPDAVYKALQKVRDGLFDCVTRTLAGGLP